MQTQKDCKTKQHHHHPKPQAQIHHESDTQSCSQTAPSHHTSAVGSAGKLPPCAEAAHTLKMLPKGGWGYAGKARGRISQSQTHSALPDALSESGPRTTPSPDPSHKCHRDYWAHPLFCIPLSGLMELIHFIFSFQKLLVSAFLVPV